MMCNVLELPYNLDISTIFPLLSIVPIVIFNNNISIFSGIVEWILEHRIHFFNINESPNGI
jgi:hypothetical protein